MPHTKNRIQENTNYYFILKCLAGLGAAAVAAAGVVAAIAASKGTAVATAALTTKALAATAAVGTTAAASIALPIVGAALLIGGICLLPFLFCRGGARPAPYVVTGPVYPAYRGGWWSNFWAPAPVVYGRGFGRGPVVGGQIHRHPPVAPPFGAYQHQHGHPPTAPFGGSRTHHQHGQGTFFGNERAPAQGHHGGMNPFGGHHGDGHHTGPSFGHGHHGHH